MRTKFSLLVLIGGALVCAGGGCTAVLVGGAAAGGVGVAAYVMGDLEAVEEVPLDKAWGASKAAIDELAFTPVSDTKDEVSAKLVTRTASDRKVTIALKRQTDELTKISIRVGVWGDEALSLKILESIREQYATAGLDRQERAGAMRHQGCWGHWRRTRVTGVPIGGMVSARACHGDGTDCTSVPAGIEKLMTSSPKVSSPTTAPVRSASYTRAPPIHAGSLVSLDPPKTQGA